jgi:hypothetical protein
MAALLARRGSTFVCDTDPIWSSLERAVQAAAHAHAKNRNDFV